MSTTSNWFGQKSDGLTSKDKWIMLWRDCPLLISSILTIIYIIAFLLTRRLRPNCRFVHVKTDIIFLTILTALGLGFVLSNTIYGIGALWYRQLAAILGYVNVFLLLGTLLYEAIYVRINFGPQWHHSLQYLAETPSLRFKYPDTDSQAEDGMVSTGSRETSLPIPPAPAPGENDILPSYDMIGSNNAAAFFGAEAPARRLSESDITDISRGRGVEPLNEAEMRLKRAILAGLGPREVPPDLGKEHREPPTEQVSTVQWRLKREVLDTLESGLADSGSEEDAKSGKSGKSTELR